MTSPRPSSRPLASAARALACCALALLPACNDRNNMYQGARLKPLESSPSEPSLPATDTPPEGTVARDPGPFDPVDKPPVSLALLIRGRDQFDTYCAPCHARDGYSDGIIVRHGFPQPPSLHDPQVRARSDDHYQTVITHGLGKMPPYGALVRPYDRWAVIAYLRALQLSQDARPEDVPDDAVFTPAPTRPGSVQGGPATLGAAGGTP